jgi:hypothetical protein
LCERYRDAYGAEGLHGGGAIQEPDIAVAQDAVPELGLDPDRRIEVPRELVSNGCVGPLERRAGFVIMVPIRAPGRRRQVPVSLERTLTMVGIAPTKVGPAFPG